MVAEKTGRVVWHDLFSDDPELSKTFYGRMAGWRFLTEHATDFAWGGGAQDFVLAMSEGEAGAGIIARPPIGVTGWLSYVEVTDVDAAAGQATKLGGTVARPPFEVPGVGRNCLLRDPRGAYVGISLSRHDYPVPKAQFGVERYLADPADFPTTFYRDLFGWDVGPAERGSTASRVISRSDDLVALVEAEAAAADPCWVPCIRVAHPAEALAAIRALKGTVFGPNTPGSNEDAVFVRDATGALICVVAR